MSEPVQEKGQDVSRKRNWLLLLPVALFALLAGVFLIRLYSDDPSRLPSALIGKKAPALSLAPLGGAVNGVDIAGIEPALFTSGAPVLLNVFASWCVPCHQEHPVLMQLAQEAGLKIIGLNYKDEPVNALRFLNARGNPYTAIGADKNGRAAIEWGAYGIPETFLVGGDGTILVKFVGPLTKESFEQRFIPALKKLSEKK